MNQKPLELYVHIPFCVKKCQYCDFLSFGLGEGTAVPDVYIEALCREIGWYGQKDDYKHRSVVSIFFGGGTPSLMSEEQIQKVMTALRENFCLQDDAEISMEVNPGTATFEKLQCLQKAGINRLSFGLQSANDNELELLGRIHNYDVFVQSYRWARAAGFKNINIDLITAVPDQTKQSYLYTLEKVLALEPEHISAYSLIIEPDTPFEVLEAEGKLNLPDEEEERRMYAVTKEALAQKGYDRYEISNYAKPGYACRHNIGYWRRDDYLGLGLGASSLIGDTRFTNTTDMSVYTGVSESSDAFIYIEERCSDATWYSDVEKLEKQSAMEEFMFLGLRMIEGVCEKDFKESFDEEMMTIYGDVITKHTANGLLKREDGRICLTEQGLDLANQVMSDFLM